MSNFVIDAYAWIEYFNGTKLGIKVKEILEDQNNLIYTNIITISELVSSYKRNSLSFEKEKNILLSTSAIYEINLDFAEEAGRLHAELKKERKNISMADIFVLLTARKLNAKVVTGDEDFKGLKEVVMIK
ncbi:PIN domain-containing protein [Candidatus Woesearchaeota archaeon]|nr:PIN domain-containing protein [Candidatus Woesearchaeota archaeon]